MMTRWAPDRIFVLSCCRPVSDRLLSNHHLFQTTHDTTLVSEYER